MRLSKIQHPSIGWSDSRRVDDSEVVREFADRCQILVGGKCGDRLPALTALIAAMPRTSGVAARVALDRVILKVLLFISLENRNDDTKHALLCAVRRMHEEEEYAVGEADVAGGREGRELGRVDGHKVPVLTPHQVRTVSRALRYIREHGCRHHFLLRHVAAAVGLSAFHLDRLLKAHTGESFVTHRTAVRIERAKGFLMGSNFSIKEVSAAVGFNNVGSFDRAFRRTCGVPPGHWRQRRLGERQARTVRTAAAPTGREVRSARAADPSGR